MGSGNGGVDHRVFVVGIVSQSLEKTLPNAAFRPAREAPVGVVPIAKALRQIAPRSARAEFPDHRLDEQTIATLAVAPDMARPSRQQVLNASKLIIPQAITFHGKALPEEGSP